MRVAIALLLAGLLLTTTVSAADQPITPLHGCDEGDTDEHCHEEKDSPGVGLLALIGLVGLVATRKRQE